MSKHEIVAQVNEVNRISNGTDFQGTLISQCDIRIDGSFEGKLTTTGKLVLGESARLFGDVVCRSCDIWGVMEGKLLVREVFGLKKSGSITGNVGCQKIFIEEGGVFNGSCKMINESSFEDLKLKLS
ncbi:MAG: polymer-forming cytoskeletal protein [Bacteroidales bacterium]|jgi:cytoskeletal protein CcmA (bactofilin family)